MLLSYFRQSSLQQSQWKVARIYQEATDGDMDPPEDVADHIESCDECKLQSIIDHHADEHDVPGVLVEKTRVKGNELIEKWTLMCSS